MERLGVAIVGPGWVAGQHIKSFVESPPTEVRTLVGTLSEDPPRAKAYMTKYGFRCESTDDCESVLGRRDIGIVSVRTINSLHFEPGRAALEAGKHTLIEKPLCLTLDELRGPCAAGKAEAAAR